MGTIHKDFTDPGIHECKGVSTATSGQIPIASGSNSVTWTTSTGSGAPVRATSPTLATPNLGVASATSINKVAITAPATSATLTIADSKTLTVSNDTTLNGGTHSGTNSGDETATRIGALIAMSTDKTTPINADYFSIWDSVTGLLQKVSWVNFKATLLTDLKDISGKLVGLTAFKINFRNTADTFTSFFINANSASRDYTFQDRNGTIADDTDLALKAPIASPTFTGTVTMAALTCTGISSTGGNTFIRDSASPLFNLRCASATASDGAVLSGFRSTNTTSSPQQTFADHQIIAMTASGYDDSHVVTSSKAAFRCYANGANWTSTSTPTRWQKEGCASGSTTRTIWEYSDSNGLSLGSSSMSITGFNLYAKGALIGTTGVTNSGSYLFNTNNASDVGTNAIAARNIYSVNAVTVTSDPTLKEISEFKLNPLQFLSDLVDLSGIISYKWQDTSIPEQRITENKTRDTIVMEKTFIQKTETISKLVDKFEEIDGKIRLTKVTEEIQEAVFETVPLYDSEGKQIFEEKTEIVKKKVKITKIPVMVRKPVMIEAYEPKEVIEYYTEETIIPESVQTHDRKHFGYNAHAIVKAFEKQDLGFKDVSMLVVDENFLDENRQPILDKDGLPIGKMAIKQGEMQAITDLAVVDLYKQLLELKEEIRVLKGK